MLLPTIYTKVFKYSLFKWMLWRSSLELGFPFSSDIDPSCWTHKADFTLMPMMPMERKQMATKLKKAMT